MYPEFVNLLNKHDILCLTETKTDDLDEINHENFIFHIKNRKKISNFRSGGIALGYRKSLQKFIHPIKTDCQFVLWFSIDGKCFNISENVIIGIVYIPPINTLYTSEDAMSEIESEFHNFQINTNHIFLVGDFNSRIGKENDFYEFSEFDEHVSEDFIDVNEFNNVTFLDTLNIPRKRNSQDLVVNSYGRKLLDFCKNNNMYVLNGRVGKDRIGKVTCKNISVVDYVVSSASSFCQIYGFEVLDFCKLFSDVHSPLCLCLSTLNEDNPEITTNKSGSEFIGKWKHEKANEFVNNIDIEKTSEILRSLLYSNEDIDRVDKTTIDVIVDDICDVLLNAAKNTFGVHTYIKNDGMQNKKKLNKEWFSTECKHARKEYRKAKRICKRYGSNIFKERLRIAEKNYKKTMDDSIRSYQNNLRVKMKNLRRKNPREFWKIWNKTKNTDVGNITTESLFNFFKEINRNNFNGENLEINNDLCEERSNSFLNERITAEEVLKAVKNIRNNKAPGDDMIINEYIFSSVDRMIDIYVYLFNIVFETGILPEAWLIGNIIPIFKNKGSRLEPQNYRPITLLSCIGKIFTSILNTRLCDYLDDLSILLENQAGFRQGYSTTDHIFSIYALFELLKLKKKKLFCIFVDFEKAFDFVQRNFLLFKLLQNNINGKFFRVIQNMYQDIKSRIVHNNEKSAFFSSEIGVRQGENLSPALFALYLNDLQQFLEERDLCGVQSISSDLENELMVYFKIFLLLYADDTVLLSENSDDLQEILNTFVEYCDKWQLKINITKTKALVFSKGRISNNLKFLIGNREIEIVKQYKYLGVYFSKSGSFLATRKYLCEQATKAMYGVLKKCRENNLSIDCQMDMFDKIVMPILLYGSEVWGFENLDMLERIHLKFCKLVLHLKQTTPSCIVYAELGRHPIIIDAKLRMINFLNRVLNGKESKISYILYQLFFIYFNNYGFEINWISFIKKIFDECGMSNIWYSQTVDKWVVKNIEQNLIDQFMQNCLADIYASPKGLCYRIFKKHVAFEHYFSKLSLNNLYTLCRFRCGNHRLPIETGRWQNVPRSDRVCHLCDSNDIGDEYHYIMSCSALSEERKRLLPYFCNYYPNTYKFEQLFNSSNIICLEKLCRFIRIINVKVVPPG